MNQNVKFNIPLKKRLNIALQQARGIPLETDLKPYLYELQAIKGYNFREANESDLKARLEALRQQAVKGVPLANLLPLVFALVNEICTRTLGLTPYDVQLLAGVVLHQGKLAQMQTGEGKTLAAVLPAVLNALTGKGVHIMTANDYLAKRDAEWMRPVYAYCGLHVASIQEKMSAEERKAAYAADITYLTAREAGFDLLRDGLCYEPQDRVQRDFNYAIIDEADFILIDEARIPLVVAGQSPQPELDIYRIHAVISQLHPGLDFTLDRAGRSANLTLAGQQHVAQLLGCGGIHEEQALPFYAAVHVALLAEHLLTRDVDYLVRHAKIELVDQFTGRVADKRRWPYGIQNALEAKEGLAIQPEGQIYGSITIQHFINLYPKVAAMTATAVSAAGELDQFYNLKTVIIPSHKPVIRIDETDQVFRTRQAKLDALCREIASVHATGQPVLLGTASVRESEELATLLVAQGIPCQVLNAKHDEQEAEYVARAGMLGAVTISTNMAGRGTDIKLGGKDGLEQERIRQSGGLYVIGTNRHESVRIDNQLRGRAGRQGDPGRSRFFISLEDPLIERYAIREFIPAEILETDRAPGEQSVSDPRVAKEVVRAQSIIEDQNYKIRQTLRKYSAFVEQQRQFFQRMRSDALKSGLVAEELAEPLQDLLQPYTVPEERANWKKRIIRIYLYYLDRFWVEHLFTVDELREGLPLQSLGGVDPLKYFLKATTDHFAAGLKNAEQQTLEKSTQLIAAHENADQVMEKFKAPASTWTYLINDNPLPAFRLAVLSNPRYRPYLVAMLVSLAASMLSALIYAVIKFL